MLDLTSLIENNKLLSNFIYFFFDTYFKTIRKIFSSFPYKTNIGVVISLHKLGDTVFTVPAVKEILKNHSGSIKIVCYPESKIIYREVFPDAEFIEIEHDEVLWDDRFVKNSARKKIKMFQPSVIYDLTGLSFLVYNIRAKEIIGMSKRQFKNVYDIYSPIRTKPHLMDTYFDVVKLKFNVDDSISAKTFPVSFNASDRILIHPFAGWKAKEWGMEKFIALAERLNKKNKTAFIAEEGKFTKDDLTKIKTAGSDVIVTNSLSELINEIKKSSLMISNDSGPLYIANLSGKSTFAIYGPTNPAFSVPYGEYHSYIQKKIHCSPPEDKQYCFTNAGRNCPSYQCMIQLSVDEVYNSLQKFIDKIFSLRHELSGTN